MIFKGKLVQFELLRIKTPHGRWIQRELVRHPGAVVIIPRKGNGRLVLIRQLRVAIGQKMWEFPAGTLERGEFPRHCAARELCEETGFRPGHLRKILEFFPTPGISTEKMHLFLADRLQKDTSRNPDWDEDLAVHSFSIAQIEHMIRRGQILDGKTILGFFCFLKYCRRE